MSHQTEWKLVADKQQLQTIQRNRQEQSYKERLKQAYLEQLSNQIKAKQQSKRRQKQHQKYQEKRAIDTSVQTQKKMIQAQKMRNRMISARLQRIQQQNEWMERQKQEQHSAIKITQQEMELKATQIAQRDQYMRQLEEQRKKQDLLRALREDLTQKKERGSIKQQNQRQFQRQKLYQGQKRKLQQQMQRQRFYHQLRVRANQLDYGSHKYFQQKYDKSLLQRKKEQWSIQRDSVQITQKMRQEEQRSRVQRLEIQQRYGDQLRRQIQQKDIHNRRKAHSQLQNDRRSISFSQEIGQKHEQMERERQSNHKRVYADFLRQQAQAKAKQREIAQDMKDEQRKMNINILGSGPGIGSIDTYQMDVFRKKQLQTIQKSFNPNRYQTVQAPQSRMGYFAGRGKTIVN